MEVMRSMPENSVDAVVCDPPYGIRFMGEAWDGADIASMSADRHRFNGARGPRAGKNGGYKSIAASVGKYDPPARARVVRPLRYDLRGHLLISARHQQALPLLQLP